MATDTNKSSRAAQARTLPKAIARGEEWTPAELEVVIEHTEATAEEIANTLGRTLYAVQTCRYLLAKGVVPGGGVRHSTPASRAQVGWAPDDPRWG